MDPIESSTWVPGEQIQKWTCWNALLRFLADGPPSLIPKSVDPAGLDPEIHSIEVVPVEVDLSVVIS